ncbi:MAG: hypothetical protein ACREH5_02025 [Candidatus Omnitrophota bacterium]
MKANLVIGLVFALMLSLASPMVFAEEMAAEAVTEAVAPMEETPAEAAPAEAPAEEAEAAIEGAIAAVDLKSENPNLTVKLADGTEAKVDLDLDLSLVLKGDEEVALEDLAAGQNVKVTQADFDGKLVADTIEIV